MRLFSVELRRYFSRSAIRGGIFLVALFTVLVSVSFFFSASPPSSEEIREAEAMYELNHAEWEEYGAQWEAECREGEAELREELGDESIDYGCDDMEPVLEDFLPWQMTQEQLEADMFGSGIMVALPIVFALAITFIASEFSTGTMSTWLTFEPRRQRVFFSKLAVGSLMAMGVVLVVAVALWAAARGIIRYLKLPPESGDKSTWLAQNMTTWLANGETFEAIIRFGLLGLFVGIVGVSLATVVRHTAGAIGVAVAYLIAEATIVGIDTTWARFSLTKHIEGVQMAGTEYYVEKCTADEGCLYTSVPIEFSTSVAVLVAFAVVSVAIGAWQFQRRDVG